MISFLKRGKKFVTTYLYKNPVFVLVYGMVFFIPGFSFKVSFYSNTECADELKKGKSMIRLGDGEIHMMNGGGIGFQKYEKEIDRALFSCIKNYTNDSKYILCINERVMNKTNKYLRSVGQLFLWLPMKVYYFLYFNKTAKYFDASAFYYKNSFDNILNEFLETKKIVLITNEKNSVNFKKSKYGNKIQKIIITPEKNSFDEYSKIRAVLVGYEGDKDIVVLLSCGPTGKLVVYEFMDKVQCLDIGHGLEIVADSGDYSNILKI